MPAPKTVKIPRELGAFETTLVPVTVTHPIFGSMPIMPGFIGCLAVLLEQDNTVNGPIAEGHRALNRAVQGVIDDLIANVATEVAKVSLASLQRNPERVCRLNAFVHADGKEYYNAVWEEAATWRPAIWSYKRADFDKRAAEFARDGYQLRDLNAFVARDGSERYNAIWEKSRKSTAAVWSYERADFDVRARELAAADFELRCVNAFVLPGQGARFNAIWEKSDVDRLSVWDWQRADFDRRERELHAQGYRLIDVNAYLPTPGAGELYNAVWERVPADTASVWAWQRSDFDRRARELSDAGFQLEALSTFFVG